MVDTTNHPPGDECKGTGFVDDPDYCADEEWYCPNCGEIGGEPRTVTSSEFQGDEAHGGVVTWDDEGCSLCIGVLV